MEWWQTLIVATVPALITAGALVLQQRWNRSTELARIAEQGVDRTHALTLAREERQHARDMAKDERAAAAEADRVARQNELRALWRAERRAAHEALVGALEQFTTTVRVRAYDLSVMSTPDGLAPDLGDWEKTKLRDGERAVDAALPNVLLLASDEAREAAAAVAQNASTLRMLVEYRRQYAWWQEYENGMRRGSTLTSEVSDLNSAYVAAARRDIGTTD